MADAGNLATALEEIREREQAATRGPWRVTQGGPGVETAWELPEGYARAGSPVPVASMMLTVGKAEREAANARFTAGARSDVPRLLAAVEAVLKDHQPGRVTVLGSLCERHENHRYFSITATEAAGVRACPDCTATVYDSCTGCGLFGYVTVSTPGALATVSATAGGFRPDSPAESVIRIEAREGWTATVGEDEHGRMEIRIVKAPAPEPEAGRG